MLVLVAGQGRLPGLLAERLDAEGRDHRIAELDGFAMDGRGSRPVISFRIERLGSFLAEIQALGATEVCFAGAVRRPALDPSAIDAATLPLVPRMMAALQAGDDAALRTVMAIFEEAGLRVTAAHEVVPELLPPEGMLTVAEPSDRDRSDAARAAAIAAATGAADVGQACVVAAGQALALEAWPGTDWMLQTLAAARATPSGLPDGAPGGGILYKAPKPGQDRRADLPVIGPGTVRATAAAGLTGIVLEAGGVMVLDRAETIAAAEKAGLFLWVRAP